MNTSKGGVDEDVASIVEEVVDDTATQIGDMELSREIPSFAEQCFVEHVSVECSEDCDVTASGVAVSYLQLFSDMYEEVRVWIKKVKDALDLVSDIDDTKAIARFQEFLQALSKEVLWKVKSTAQIYIDYAATLRENKNAGESASDLGYGLESSTTQAEEGESSLSTSRSGTSPQPEKIPRSLPELNVIIFKSEPNLNALGEATLNDHNYYELNNSAVVDVSVDELDKQSNEEKVEESKFRCDICSECFTTDEGLTGHLDITHVTCENPLVCVKCEASFASARKFMEHVESEHSDVASDKCAFCGKSYRVKTKMLKHLEEHRLMFKCDVCDMAFSQKHILKSHRETHTGELGEDKADCDNFRCDVCHVQFTCSRELTRHTSKQHSTRKRYSCSSCNRSFLSTAGLKKHTCKQNTEQKFSCSYCNKSFSTKAAAGYHIKRKVCRSTISRRKPRRVNTRSVSNQDGGRDKETAASSDSEESADGDSMRLDDVEAEEYNTTSEKRRSKSESAEGSQDSLTCDICAEEFLGKKAYDAHYSTVHFFGKKPLSCLRCDLHPPFTHLAAFTRHVSTAHPEDPTSVCMFCDKINIKNMSRHITRNHLYLFKCDLCSREFGDKYMLISHRRIHSDDCPYQCTICGKKFRTLDYCKTHERTAHSNQKNFACHVCGERFRARHNLKFHIERKHNPNVPFVCEHCGRGCPTKTALRRHLFVHVKHQKYQCAVCKKCFAHAAALRHHDESHHGRTEGKWQCTICGKTMLKGRKESHLRAHSGERPYVCQICQKSYAWPGLLREHKLTHTTDTPFQCKLCKKAFNNSGNLRKHTKTYHENN